MCWNLIVFTCCVFSDCFQCYTISVFERIVASVRFDRDETVSFQLAVIKQRAGE